MRESGAKNTVRKMGKLAAPIRRVNHGTEGGLFRCVGWLGLALYVLGSCQRTSHESASSSASSSSGVSSQDAFRQPHKLIAALSLQPGQRVAEIGAGGGYLTPYLAHAVGPKGQVMATDVDEAALVALRRRTDKLPQVTTRKVLASESGLEPAHYDLILLADVFHLVPQPDRYLRSLFVCLRAGGRIVVSGRIDRRAILEQAATQAGLTLSELAVELPAQFVTEVRRAK